MYISNSQPAPIETLPTMYDLPSENPEEPGLPDEFHGWQAHILCDTCCPPNYPADQVFLASDLNLYYDSQHVHWYKRPDFFLVVGIPRLYQEKDLRLSYVIWQEKLSPLVAVELLSPGTEDEDLGLTESEPNKPPTKWQVYEQILKIPYYFVFSRYTNRLRVFHLRGNRYREQILTEPRFWIEELELGIGLWLGDYQGCQRLWLRWYDNKGNWIPTPKEQVEQERFAKEFAIQRAEAERLDKESALQRVEQERFAKEFAIQRAEAERLDKESAIQQAEAERLDKESALQRAEKLAERLRLMGINPDDL
ncbi:Uma2 family endonuclease [Limnofasciculus baicalensis]|uniref:Uma2 family endonuclease n=1 Tax=Limnofasciculus baicalensis BBK-W-15 TaxID=2699891 RepID=A0AAE3GU93_9CYAN|nr:Uma2 family endonuclease [Limnofasciculus baicalensis]MCP2730825.1 Uma2 family endonuclease [Limnofasciculus baicalensis BBK-W-15]